MQPPEEAKIVIFGFKFFEVLIDMIQEGSIDC